MYSVRMLSQRMNNLLHSGALLLALLALLCLIGWLLAGGFGIVWAVFLGIAPFIVGLRIHPFLVLRMYGAKELAPDDAPQLFAMVEELGRRASLAAMPHLYHIGSRVALVFSVGQGERAAIALSDGMLRLLTLRELVCVLAHETSHIRNNDTWVMSFADVVSRVTGTISLLGQILVLVNLPFYILGDLSLPWLPLLLMASSPFASGILQLALSRTREFDADL